MYLLVLVAIGLIFASIFYNFTSYDSRPLISIYWILSGALLGPLLAFVFSRFKNQGAKFYIVISLMTAMLFSGVGFVVKAQQGKKRYQEILHFSKAPAQFMSCRSGEENPGKHRNPEGRFFPIWTYQFRENNSGTVAISQSNSIPDFSIRKKFKSSSEADAACRDWKSDEERQVYYDPLKPELSLMEIPAGYDLFAVDVFLGILFSLVSISGLMAMPKVTVKE